MKAIALLILLLLPSVGYGQGNLNNETSAANSTLEKLRSSIDLVRSAGKDDHFVAQPYDPSPLIGMSRTQIKSALGTPKICDSVMVTPCQRKGDWFYSFYKLPENSLGGGPELLLKFDKDDLCTYAVWVMTQ